MNLIPKMMSKLRVIISGGGTGGHIFPAIAIANALKKLQPDTEILFVGALGKMEMEKVPEAGYRIIGLPIMGLKRKVSFSVFKTLMMLMISLVKAKRIIKTFQPDVVVGVGGYASGPVLRKAVKLKIPALIQEQNSFAGMTNKLLGSKVAKICVAYEGMEKYFPKEKIVLTGNPVRKDLLDVKTKSSSSPFDDISKKETKVLFITGGSLGARTLNEAVINHIDLLKQADVQVIWQTGKLYIKEMKQRMAEHDISNIRMVDFVSRMDLVYALAHVVICRSGALTCAELALTGKASILVPSPNVAEDHQTKNAMALVNKNAALMVNDVDAKNDLIPKALELLNDIKKQQILVNNIRPLAKPDADIDIAKEIIKLKI